MNVTLLSYSSYMESRLLCLQQFGLAWTETVTCNLQCLESYKWKAVIRVIYCTVLSVYGKAIHVRPGCKTFWGLFIILKGYIPQSNSISFLLATVVAGDIHFLGFSSICLSINVNTISQEHVKVEAILEVYLYQCILYVSDIG